MEYIIGGLLFIIIIMTIVIWNRNRYYKMLDQLEEWKMDLWNRPVAEELVRIKNLRMTGQTEETYERWKQLWDTVLSKDLPEIEEGLFDIETAIDKYQFRKARKLQVAVEAKLYTTENKLNTMMEEIEKLIGSEEAGRGEIEQLMEVHQELRKRLISFRNTFSTGEAKLEELLDAVVFQFQEFDQLTKDGDYLFAQETMLEIKAQIEAITLKMDRLPYYIREVRQTIYETVDDLQNGYQVMKQQGYGLEHLQFDKEIKAIESEIIRLEELLTSCDIKQLEIDVTELKSRLQEWYDKFELEVKARRSLPIVVDEVRKEFAVARDIVFQLRQDTPKIKNTFKVPTDNLINIQDASDRVASLEFQFEKMVEQKIGKGAQYSVLQGNAENIRHDLVQIIELVHSTLGIFTDYAQSQEKYVELEQTLIREFADVSKMVAKSNIPGVSPGYDVLFQDAKDKLTVLSKRLTVTPFDVAEIELYGNDATEAVNTFIHFAAEMMETFEVSERLIQYSNRYRRKNQQIARILGEAEIKFRQFNYDVAYEIVAEVLEDIEPGAVERIRSLILDPENR